MAADPDLVMMAAPISSSQFKTSCLGLVDQVSASGEGLVITKNGQPGAELHPCGLHADVEIHGDLLAPIDSPWSALE